VPQLPPVAAAAFILTLLTAIVVTTVIVQTRARRRRMRLAEMVRATAPLPRPAVSVAELSPASKVPLRGQSYDAAREAGRFEPSPERRRREPAPGRPARRLAAHIAHAAAAAPATVGPAGAVADASPRYLSHGGLAEVASALLEPRGEPGGVPSGEPVRGGVPSAASPPLSARPVEAEPASAPPPRPGALREPASPSEARAREPRVTVLAARPAAPALPALMTHEFALGDAARLLREALPPALTMTDGRQLRRAVAVGAATSVVAAAFVIRGRRR